MKKGFAENVRRSTLTVYSVMKLRVFFVIVPSILRMEVVMSA